jgi:hypothetical protein
MLSRKLFLIYHLDSGTYAVVFLFSLLLLKWQINQDVKLNYNYLTETELFVNRYRYNRGQRGFFPTRGFEDNRVVAGP